MKKNDTAIYKISFDVKATKSIMVHVPKHLIHSDENIKLFLDTHASPLYWDNEQLESDPEPDLDNPKIEYLSKSEYEDEKCFEISEVMLSIDSIPNSIEFDILSRARPQYISIY